MAQEVERTRDNILALYRLHYLKGEVASALGCKRWTLQTIERRAGVSEEEIDAAREEHYQKTVGHLTREELIDDIRRWETPAAIGKAHGTVASVALDAILRNGITQAEMLAVGAHGQLLRSGFDREYILAGIREHGSVTALGDSRGLDSLAMHRALPYFNVNREDVVQAVRDHKREACERGYDELAAELGRPPNEEDFIRTGREKLLKDDIKRAYGSLIQFKYEYLVTRERILQWFAEGGSLQDYAPKTGVNYQSVIKAAMRVVTREELDEASMEYRRKECKRMWDALESRLGRQPNGTDLRDESRESQVLSQKIWRVFGGVKEFREHFGIEFERRRPALLPDEETVKAMALNRARRVNAPPRHRERVPDDTAIQKAALRCLVGSDYILASEANRLGVSSISNQNRELLDNMASALERMEFVDWGGRSDEYRRNLIWAYIEAQDGGFERKYGFEPIGRSAEDAGASLVLRDRKAALRILSAPDGIVAAASEKGLTIPKVGDAIKQLGISRNDIREAKAYVHELKGPLADYEVKDEPRNREEFLDLFSRTGSYAAMAQTTGIPSPYLRKLRKEYGIQGEELWAAHATWSHLNSERAQLIPDKEALLAGVAASGSVNALARAIGAPPIVLHNFAQYYGVAKDEIDVAREQYRRDLRASRRIFGAQLEEGARVKDVILHDIGVLGSIAEVAREYGVDKQHMQKKMRKFGVSHEEMQAAKEAFKQNERDGAKRIYEMLRTRIRHSPQREAEVDGLSLGL